MLQITIPACNDAWDGNEFVTTKEQTLRLEHSLVSLSKWESKWRKPYLTKEDKTLEETIDYIKCMTLTQNVDPNVYNFLTQDNVNEIIRYIHQDQTATTFTEHAGGVGGKNSGEQLTAEVIYYWMIALNIPVEFQKWHLSRLLTLIRVCSIKNQPPKKMSRNEALSRQRSLNAARRRKMNTKG